MHFSWIATLPWDPSLPPRFDFRLAASVVREQDYAWTEPWGVPREYSDLGTLEQRGCPWNDARREIRRIAVRSGKRATAPPRIYETAAAIFLNIFLLVWRQPLPSHFFQNKENRFNLVSSFPFTETYFCGSFSLKFATGQPRILEDYGIKTELLGVQRFSDWGHFVFQFCSLA